MRTCVNSPHTRRDAVLANLDALTGHCSEAFVVYTPVGTIEVVGYSTVQKHNGLLLAANAKKVISESTIYITSSNASQRKTLHSLYMPQATIMTLGPVST